MTLIYKYNYIFSGRYCCP